MHLLYLGAELGQHSQVVWLALGRVPAVISLQLEINHTEMINIPHWTILDRIIVILLRVHPCFVHHPESFVQVIVI